MSCVPTDLSHRWTWTGLGSHQTREDGYLTSQLMQDLNGRLGARYAENKKA